VAYATVFARIFSDSEGYARVSSALGRPKLLASETRLSRSPANKAVDWSSHRGDDRGQLRRGLVKPLRHAVTRHWAGAKALRSAYVRRLR
jgi:hypothetical protein